jgi:hypothetical protein
LEAQLAGWTADKTFIEHHESPSMNTSMNTLQAAAERRARCVAGAHFVLTALLMTAVTRHMIDVPESFDAGSLLLGPLAYFGAVSALLFCFPRRMPGWALRVVPLALHWEFREFFGISGKHR